MTRAPFQRLRARATSRGVAIVTAIFLLVALAGLAVAVVTLTTAQQSASAQDVMGQRAYQAAKTGIEVILYNGLRTGPTPPTPATTLGCTADKTFKLAMPAGTTLSAFAVTVRCEAAIPGLGSNDANDTTAGHFRITSTACNQPVNNACPNPAPGPDYVQRQLRAQL